MRIGILANSWTGGGAERQAAQWAAVISQWPDAELSLLSVHDYDKRFALPAGVPVTTIGKRNARDFVRVARGVRRFLRTVDIAIAFQSYPAIFCIGGRNPVPLLLVTGDDPRYHWKESGMPNRLIYAAFRSAAAASAPAPELVDCYVDLGVQPRGPWLCIPNIADDAAFVESPTAKSGVLFVGRLEDQKDPLLAIETCLAADAELTVLGDGSLRGAVHQAAAADSRIRPHDFTSHPWELYAKHRALLLTSAYEPFGNVIVESLAAGTPVVSVDCDYGPRHVLADARFSTVVPSRDPAVLAGALREVLDREYTTEEAAECSRYAERYRVSAIDPMIRDAVEQTLAVPRRRRFGR